MLSDRCPVSPVLSDCETVTLVLLYVAKRLDGSGYAGRPRPSPKGAQPPISTNICCGQLINCCMDQDATW